MGEFYYEQDEQSEKQDCKKAEEYFRKILEVGNEQDKVYAEYYLDLL